MKNEVHNHLVLKRALSTMMAYNSSLYSRYTTSMVGDLQSTDMSLVMESPFSFNQSTGYLEDAIADWRDRCKRPRQTLSYTYDQMNCPNSDDQGDDPFINFASMETNSFADDCLLNSSKIIKSNLSTSPMGMNAGGTKEQENHSSSCSFQMGSALKDIDENDVLVSKGCSGVKKIAYPFEVVKPGGIKGEITLDDINRQMLMRPMKPIRHPVGDFAMHPCVSADGFGMSGKAVVALTKIHTQGRGTITIIRTKG